MHKVGSLSSKVGYRGRSHTVRSYRPWRHSGIDSGARRNVVRRRRRPCGSRGFGHEVRFHRCRNLNVMQATKCTMHTDMSLAQCMRWLICHAFVVETWHRTACAGLKIRWPAHYSSNISNAPAHIASKFLHWYWTM